MTENRYAVLIGISHYQDQNLQTLKYPENDVDGLNEIFLSKEHGNFSETLPLKNKPSHEILLEIEQILESHREARATVHNPTMFPAPLIFHVQPPLPSGRRWRKSLGSKRTHWKSRLPSASW